MLLYQVSPRHSFIIRLVGLGLVCWSVVDSRHAPGTSGRGLVVLVTLVVAGACWLAWLLWPGDHGDAVTADIYVMAAAGGFLTAASPSSAGSAFAFVACVSAAVRVELARAWPVGVLAALALGAGVLVYDGSAIGVLAFSLGFAGAMLASSNARQARQRAEQAELLLAQTQRSQEERLRAARLEESTRIARDIHDVLAHALAGLAIQLEATTALIENDADRDAVLARVRRAHELAREGLRETRRAVGALRDGGATAVPEAIEAVVEEYRAGGDAPARLQLRGDVAELIGDAGQTVLRVVQESVTNVRKHAPGAELSVTVDAGAEEIVVVIEDRAAAVPVTAGSLADSGGGYGVQGMRERAAALGGTLNAGPTAGGWRVELRLPVTAPARRATS